MAVTNIPINSGTGPKVAVDLIGTTNFQVVKIMQATDGATASLTDVLTVTAAGTVVVTAANVTVASITTGTMTVVGTVAVSGTTTVIPSGTQNVNIVTGGGQQYSQGSTAMAATATGIVIMGMQSGATTGRAIAITTSGQQLVQISTGTVSIVGTPAVTAANVTIASITTGTVTIVGTVAISGTVDGSVAGVQYVKDSTTIAATGTGTLIMGIQSTTARALLLHTTGGLIIASMPAVGGGQQYSAAATDMGATGTGTLFIGLQTGATTGRAIALTVSGQQLVQVATGTVNIAAGTITTLLGTVAVSGAGGGAQYTVDTTAMAATATGTIILGMQSGATTARGIAVTATGAQFITGTVGALMLQALDATNDTVGVFGLQTGSAVRVAIQVSTTGGLYIASGGGAGTEYSVGGTNMAATGTGPLMIGVQTGATTGRAIALTTTGAQIIAFVTTQAVTAANVTIASVTTGTMSVVNVLSATGVLLGATTAGVGAVVVTHHASNWSAAAVSTTSGGGHAILKTSGAHTLYVTDLMFSVDVPMRVDVYSSSAAQAAKISVYLAAKGGFVMNLKSPMALTSAQSLVFIGAASGSLSAFAAGYTVT